MSIASLRCLAVVDRSLALIFGSDLVQSEFKEDCVLLIYPTGSWVLKYWPCC